MNQNHDAENRQACPPPADCPGAVPACHPAGDKIAGRPPVSPPPQTPPASSGAGPAASQTAPFLPTQSPPSARPSSVPAQPLQTAGAAAYAAPGGRQFSPADISRGDAGGALPLREKYQFKLGQSLFALLFLLLGYLFIRWIFFGRGALDAFLFCLAFYPCLIGYFAVSGVKLRPGQVGFTLFLLLFSLHYLLYGGGFLTFFTSLFLVCASLYLIGCIGGGEKLFAAPAFFTRLARHIFVAPFTCFGALFAAIAKLFAQKGGAKKGVGIFVGLVIALPLSLILIALLSSADAGFARMSEQFFASLGDQLPFHLFQLFLGVLSALFLFGAFAASLRQRREKTPPAPEEGRTIAVPVELICAALTPVLLLYILFFVSQSAYFLAAFGGQLPADMSFAEYARRGFFELCAVAAINALLLFAATVLTKNIGKTARYVRDAYRVILIVFTLILVACAISKLYLYIRAYGLTLTRVYAAWFLVLLSIFFLITLVQVFWTRLKLVKALAVSFLTLFLILCLGSPDYLVAQYNVSAYESGLLAEMDVGALYGLSDEAVEPAARLLDDKDPLVAGQAQDYLTEKAIDYLQTDQGAMSWHLAGARAKAALDEAGIWARAKNELALRQAADTYVENYGYDW